MTEGVLFPDATFFSSKLTFHVSERGLTFSLPFPDKTSLVNLVPGDPELIDIEQSDIIPEFYYNVQKTLVL